jgi:lactate dehydrogenase-like 2-hydroxyacid dehydrogenase
LDNNYKIFSKKFFSKIRKDAFLINTSRGDIFDEKYFIKFFKSKKYNGLGLDVLPSDVIWKNKIPKKYQFIKNLNSNFILTPHVGGNTLETRAKTTEFILSNFLKIEKLI